MLDTFLLVTGIIIFFARVGDVSIGNIRTIVTIQGRSVIAFVLAVFEHLIWIAVASTVISQMKARRLLAIFYALGYATGNVAGIALERRLALGTMILRVITRTAGTSMAATVRAMGQAVTVFRGEGMRGPVDELYIACRRRDLNRLLQTVREEDPQAFYITEMARDVRKAIRPTSVAYTGWRGVLKKK